MDSPKNSEVRATLFENLIAAVSDVAMARREFIKVTGNVPGDLSCPDGTQRFKEVSRKLADAIKTMKNAQTRLNDYLNCGVAPEDLKRDG